MEPEAFEQTYVGPPPTGLLTQLQQLPVVDRGHYIDRVEIARGGMGRIVVARDRRIGRAVAIKELCADTPAMRVRFAREALLTARLSHPSIVSVHEVGVWPEGVPFYAMKLVAGRSFEKVIAAAPMLAMRLALIPHVLAVADALAYAHQRRVIHRDLKPHNVLIGRYGETVVIDWGLAKDLDDDDDVGATSFGEVLGTPAHPKGTCSPSSSLAYMPPEQAAGIPVDERADVYAIGAILYHLLAGVPAYDGSSAVGVCARVISEEPPPLATVKEGIPHELHAIVARAMARDPVHRYRDAHGIADALRQFQAGLYATPTGRLIVADAGS